MSFDSTDFYIKYKGHPKFNDIEIIEDELVKVIVQKIELILFTMKGEVYGDPDFGGDLYRLLHSTMVNSNYVKDELSRQFSRYIPEMDEIGYSMDVSFAQNPNDFADMMFIDIKIREFEVNAYFE